MNDTRGTAILHTEFLEYQDYKGPLKKNLKGALISNTEGVCQAFGLKEIENKGTLFVKPGMKVREWESQREIVVRYWKESAKLINL